MKNIYLVALGVVLLLSGCSHPPMKAYEGPKLPESKVANLSVTPRILMQKIDGKVWHHSTNYNLIPGKHSVLAKARISAGLGLLVPSKPTRIIFTAKAGHAYEISAGGKNIENVSGNQYKADFYYWIIDKKTGKVVGGRKPDNQ